MRSEDGRKEVPAAWRIDTLPGGARLRPAGLTDAETLWGVERGKLARMQIRSGATVRFEQLAWDVSTASGRVAWRNGEGAWQRRTGSAVERIAGPEPVGEFDGPPDLLLSPDGIRILLSWRGEWALHHELWSAGGERRALAVRDSGYMAHGAHLWLDSTHVLFGGVAIGPLGAAPEYRESGWRGDLFILDVEAGAWRRVTEVPDGVFLRAAGWLGDELVVTEHDGSGVRAHWRYDPRTWQRRPLDLPAGRAFARGRIVIVYVEADPEVWQARLASADSTMLLGQVADPDLPPAFAADGATAVIRIGNAVAGYRLIAITPD